jgi:hypothetical protein
MSMTRGLWLGVVLAAVPTDRQPSADRDRFESAAAEFVAVRRSMRTGQRIARHSEFSTCGAAAWLRPRSNIRRRCG